MEKINSNRIRLIQFDAFEAFDAFSGMHPLRFTSIYFDSLRSVRCTCVQFDENSLAYTSTHSPR